LFLNLPVTLFFFLIHLLSTFKAERTSGIKHPISLPDLILAYPLQADMALHPHLLPSPETKTPCHRWQGATLFNHHVIAAQS
jgi:hypothetical protein